MYVHGHLKEDLVVIHVVVGQHFYGLGLLVFNQIWIHAAKQ